jgi:hypothetical protein
LLGTQQAGAVGVEAEEERPEEGHAECGGRLAVEEGAPGAGGRGLGWGWLGLGSGRRVGVGGGAGRLRWRRWVGGLWCRRWSG